VEVEIFIENNSMNDKMRYGKTNLLLFAMVFIGLVVIFSYSVGNVAAASNGTIYVNAAGGNDNYDGQSATYTSGIHGPKLSIKNATGTVDANGTVNIANGQYTGVNNTNINILKNMNITGKSEAGTIINGNGTNRIFYVDMGITLNILNLTLTNGNNATYGGGAIFNYYGTLNVRNSTFTSNSASGTGGAILNEGTLTVMGSTFNGNSVSGIGGYGGAIGGPCTVTDSTFTSNSATGPNGNGGAINGECTVTGSTFTGNSASSNGGAIYHDGGGISLIPVTISGSTFNDNTASSNGGAIYNTGGNCTVTGGTFNSNTATDGGAIYNNAGVLNVTGGTFTGNTANGGGAIYEWLGSCTVTGSTFNSNTATLAAGAIQNDGTSNVTGCTFTGNSAADGGAIFNVGTLNVTGSTFTGNSASGGGGAIGNTDTANVHFNRIVGNTATRGNGIDNEGGAVEAALNWWGSNNGPFDTSGDTITYSPWLIMNVGANPTLIKNGGTSTITADLLHDSTYDPTNPSASYHNPASGHVPDGIPVTFKTNLGTINSPVSTSNGISLATLNSGTVSGPATVSATIDSQTLQTLVTIDTIPPTAKASLNSGLYNTNKIVTLSMSEPGTIYYTLNGITPTTTYTDTGPITITKTTILKYLAVDLAGNKSPIYTNTYTIDKIPPKVIKTTPINKRTNVSRISTIVLKFSENIKASTYFNKITIKNSAGKILKLTKTIKGTTLSIKTTKRTANTWYIVTIPRAAIKDNAGNNLATIYTFKFKTGK